MSARARQRPTRRRATSPHVARLLVVAAAASALLASVTAAPAPAVRAASGSPGVDASTLAAIAPTAAGTAPVEVTRRPPAQTPTSKSAPASSPTPDPLARAGVLWKPRSPGVPAPPAPKARSWIVVDAESGAVLAAARARSRQFPASTLKTLTAVALLPELDLSEVYTATAADVGIHGSGAGLVVGGTYTVEQLFLGLLLPSGNDAAVALTHVYDRDGSKAIALMNRTARALGARATTARTPHGLPDPRQLTTAADLAVIARAAVANPTFRRLAQTRTVDFPGRMPKAGATRRTYQLQNENPFIRHGVPGTIAGKTGFTRASLRTYWVAVSRGGRTLLVVMLGFVGSYKELALRLLNWGFAHRSALTPVTTLPPLPSLVGQVVRPAASTASQAPAVKATRSSPAGRDLPRQATAVLLLLVPALVLGRRAVRVHRGATTSGRR